MDANRASGSIDELMSFDASTRVRRCLISARSVDTAAYGSAFAVFACLNLTGGLRFALFPAVFVLGLMLIILGLPHRRSKDGRIALAIGTVLALGTVLFFVYV